MVFFETRFYRNKSNRNHNISFVIVLKAGSTFGYLAFALGRVVIPQCTVDLYIKRGFSYWTSLPNLLTCLNCFEKFEISAMASTCANH